MATEKTGKQVYVQQKIKFERKWKKENTYQLNDIGINVKRSIGYITVPPGCFDLSVIL